MDVFVIGGTGFISTLLVKRLLERGDSVTMFTRGSSPSPFERHDRLACMTGDRRDADALARAAGRRRYDAVYDMVAYGRDDSLGAVRAFRGKTERFIHCSTVSVYMVSDRTQCPVTEDQIDRPLMPAWDRNPFGMTYGIRKRECEELLWQAHDDRLFPVSMLRPTFVSGPGDPAMRDWFWAERILDGGPLLVPGSGDFAFMQVYVDDVAKAFADLLDHPESAGRAYNIAAEEIFSLNEWLGALGAILGRRPRIARIGQESFQSLPLSTFPGADVFPYNVQRTAVFSLDAVRRDLGYRSTPFVSWMTQTLEWFRRQGRHSHGYARRNEEIELAGRLLAGAQEELHEH